jgi:hypothetical protein
VSEPVVLAKFDRWRQVALWLCLGLFVARVMGQIEVTLLSPSWLPPFRAWESGLIPYSVLLPIQILLIAWMAIVTSDHWRGSGYFWVTLGSTRRRLKIIVGIYFAIMLFRLAITVAIPPHTLLERGLIPVMAHWDIAAFIYLTACTPPLTYCHSFSGCTFS